MSLKQARLALTEEQDAYRGRRAAAAGGIRAKLPQAQELADEIRRVFMNAVEHALSRADENAFMAAGERSTALQRELAELLTSNGFEPDALFDLPMCRDCADTGYIGAKMCGCLEKHMRGAREAELSALKAGTFEDDFRLDIFSSQTEPEWGLSQRENMEGNLAYCRSWAKNFSPRSPNLFLNGGTGQGKTFMCSCIARKVSDGGASVRYAAAVSMFRDFENKHFDRGVFNTDIYYNSDLLIIDDLGTEMTTRLSSPRCTIS